MKRVQLILFWILTATTFSFGQATTLYYPQVTNGLLGSSIWKTTIFLGNPAASGVASGTVTLFQEVPSDPKLAGVPFNSISFVDESGAPVGSGNTIPFQIAPGQSRKFTSTGVGDYHGGFAVVSANAPINGAAVFSAFYADGSSSEGGLSSSPAVTKQAIFVDTTNGYNVGVALANPTTSQMTVSLSLLLNTGAAAAQPTTVTLGANNHKAAFVSELFQGIGPMVGSMQVSSATAVPAVALRFDPSFKVFTTLPPFTLASLISPAMDWLEQRPLFSGLTSIAKLLSAFQHRLV
jgi:hypothetical protein